MRASLMVGILLLLAGGFVLVRGFSVTTDRKVFDVGPLEASVEEKRAVPTWLGGVAVAAGLVLIIAGAAGPKRA